MLFYSCIPQTEHNKTVSGKCNYPKAKQDQTESNCRIRTAIRIAIKVKYWMQGLTVTPAKMPALLL